MATADEGTEGKDSGSADGARKSSREPEHTHRTREEWIDGVLFLNPGSAGRERRNRVATLTLLRIEEAAEGEAGADVGLHVEFVELGA